MRYFLAAITVSMLLVTGSVSAQQFQEGQHFRVLSSPVATTTGDKIEVREFFSYGCPHCNTFHPRVLQLAERLPDDAQLVHSPVIFSQAWQPLAQAFLAADALGVVDEMHGAIFAAYHRDRKPMGNVDEVARIFSDEGVEEQDFRSAWNSFGVDSALRRVNALAREYRVESTPTMAVNGKYLIDVRMAGGQENLIRVVEYLVERERQAKQ